MVGWSRIEDESSSDDDETAALLHSELNDNAEDYQDGRVSLTISIASLVDRDSRGLSSVTQSVFNSVNQLMGVGLLSYPFVLKLSGWSGVGLLLIFSLICNHTAKLMGEMMDMPSHVKLREGPGSHTILGFFDIARAALGRVGAMLVSILYVGETFGFGCIYLIIESDNLRELLGHYSWCEGWGKHEFMVLSLCIFLPLWYLRDLSLLSYFSALGACAAACLFMGVAVSGLEGSQPNPIYCPPQNCTGSILQPSHTVVARWDSIPSVVGLGMVGFVGHAQFPTFRNSMADKSEYPRVINTAYVIATIVYLGIASAGYLMFGDYCQEEITLNLGSTWFSQLVVWIVVANPLTKFPLSMAPIGLSCENAAHRLLNTPPYGHASEDATACTRLASGAVFVLVRTCLALAALTVVSAIPSFGLVMGVIGATCSFSIAVTLPCLFYLSLQWRSLSVLRRASYLGLVTFGVVGSVLGTVASIARHMGPHSGRVAGKDMGMLGVI